LRLAIVTNFTRSANASTTSTRFSFISKNVNTSSHHSSCLLGF
jgi:hypothetical protein